MVSTQHVALTAHASAPVGGILCGADVGLRGVHREVLEIRFAMDADMSGIRVPIAGEGKRADGLWKHTCFEVFIACSEAPGYYELNFSPSLDWAIYRFAAYREGMSVVEVDAAPALSAQRDDGKLELRSAVDLAQLPGVCGAYRLRIGLAAVIEDRQGGLSYWAARHAAGKPDFHHPDGFALEINRT